MVVRTWTGTVWPETCALNQLYQCFSNTPPPPHNLHVCPSDYKMQIFRPFQDTKSRCWLRDHDFSLILFISPVTCHRVSWPEQGHQERTSGHSGQCVSCHMAKVKRMHFPVWGFRLLISVPVPSSMSSLGRHLAKINFLVIKDIKLECVDGCIQIHPC